MHKLWILVAVAALLLASGAVFAQDEDPGTIYQKVTRYKIKGDTITGESVNPRMERIEGLREHRSQSLIRFRQDFRSKVLASAKKI